MENIIVLQHAPCETVGLLQEALTAADLKTHVIRSFEGAHVPKEMGQSEGLIVMGGPMGVYEQDRFPFLREEMKLIDHALKEKKPILGVCLGSQLLAAALGANVYAGPAQEIGWYPVTLLPEADTDPLLRKVPSPVMALRWHGDVFDLPKGAVRLAYSEKTDVQAFRYGKNAFGFLFHMEMTAHIIEEMVKTFSSELQQEKLDGTQIVAQSKNNLPALAAVGRTVFHRWTRLLRQPSMVGVHP